MEIKKLTDAEYFALPHINCSSLKKIAKSPATYKYSLTAPKEESKAFLIGSALHCLVLEPHLFYEQYIKDPGINKRTNAGKAEYEALKASGKIILSVDDWEQVLGMTDSVMNNLTAAKLLSSGSPEQTVLTEIEGVPAKCKIDWLRSPQIIVDLKTTDDASEEGFARNIAKFGYDMQAAWYLDCTGLDYFIFIVVEKSPPYLTNIFQMGQQSINVGRTKYLKALAQYKQCLESDYWPGYSEEIKTIEMPNWALKEVY